MKRDNINYLAAGLVVLGALALLLAVLYKITGRGGPTDGYYARYDVVAGLRYGTPVYFEGYRVGEVTEITPVREGSRTRFRVDLSVQKDWPIPADSIAQIATAGLLSDVFIVLNQGDSEELLAPGSEIEGQEASDVFTALGNLAGDVSALTESRVEPLLELISERVDSITASIDTSTPLVVDDLRSLLGRLNESAERLQNLMSPQNLSAIDSTLNNVEQSSAHLRALTEELERARKDISGLAAELHGLALENRPQVSRTVDQIEIIATLLGERLDSIAFNLDEASRNLNEFARTIRKTPNRLLFSPPADEPEVD